MSDTQNHPYHLVDPSPWPLLGSVAAFLTTLGAVLFFHSDDRALGDAWLMVIGFISIFSVMFCWWSDVIGESRTFHNKVVSIGLRYGMSLFIASEVMFFVAFFWAFFHNAFEIFSPGVSVWPPEGIEVLDPFDIPLLNTVILLTSGFTLTWGHHAVIEGKRDAAIQGIGLTVLLGLIFMGFQIYEYGHATFGFTDGIYASTFYMATGFHGFHVFVGTVFLIVCLYRQIKGDFRPAQHFGLEAAAWYWHFVDVVWLFLFVAVYIWGA